MQSLKIVSVDENIERLVACPLCFSANLVPIKCENLISRSPKHADKIRAQLGADFFSQQALGYCADCTHVFQLVRPSAVGLRRLYGCFLSSLGKAESHGLGIYDAVLRTYRNDFVISNGYLLDILDHEKLLDGVESVMEMRSVGGGVLAVLSERGIPHVEGGYVDDFDRIVAEKVFNVRKLTPFSFADDIHAFRPSRDKFDLIIFYEGLTHCRDPYAVLDWCDQHLAPRGRALFFHEPDVPARRVITSLSVTFNHFHMQHFNRRTFHHVIKTHGKFSLKIRPSLHPDYSMPIYLNLIVGRTGERTELEAASVLMQPRVGRRFYMVWQFLDRHPSLGRIWRKIARILATWDRS